MDKKQGFKLEKSLGVYFKDIHKIYTDGDFREESFYPSFKLLIEDCSKLYQTQAGVVKSLDISRLNHLIPTSKKLKNLSNSKDTGILSQILS